MENNNKCSPATEFRDGSCISLELLIEMAKAYNIENKNKQIKLHASLDALNPGKYKKYLVKEFENRLNDICDTQTCWIKQDFINRMQPRVQEELRKHTFLPEGPTGKFEWLNTLHINDVMAQYEKKFKDFKFFGAVPIDFDDLPQLGIKNLDFDKLRKQNINRIGLVFNLDKHNEPGSHWVGAYSDLKNGHIFFFDSYGERPHERIRKFMRRIATYLKESGHNKIRVEHNNCRHQYKNSECGVYSLNFIIELLEGEEFHDLCSKRTPDDIINKYRDRYFRKS